jgi:protein O-mannosyl-transferase
MNADDCLSKDRHDQRIGCISSRELHVVSELVRRDALQNELTGIGILAFIALQRNTKKSDANSDHHTKNDHREKNPRGFQNSVAFYGLALHQFFNETTDYRAQWLGKQREKGKKGERGWEIAETSRLDSRRGQKVGCSPCSSLAKSMAKRTAGKRKTARTVAATGCSAGWLSHVPTFGRPDLLILLGLAVVTFAIYAQVVGHQFITLDDPTYIQENPMVNRGVTRTGLAWAFTTFHAANWHPLTWISHMIDCQLFGMNAGRQLLVNALIHVANTLLVFWFLLRTTHARWPSALVAALFALHPLHVESVAWASERKDTLCTFFGLLSLMAYVRYTEAPSRKRYTWIALTLGLGLLAKPMLVTWPFVMLLLDYWPLRRFQRPGVQRRLGSASHSEAATATALVREKLPLFAIAAASCVITMFAQSHGGAVHTLAAVPVAVRLSNALVSYAKYLLLTFWPNDLAVYYPFAGIPAWQIIGAAFLLIGITAFCLFQRRTRPYLIVGWLWFLGTLVPVIGIVQVGGQIMADRYFYIPSIGLFIALVFGLADIAKSWRVAPALCAGVAGVILVILAMLTNAQIQRWRDSFALFEHTLGVTPPNLRIEHNLGVALAVSDRYNEAAAHFEKALQINPISTMAW